MPALTDRTPSWLYALQDRGDFYRCLLETTSEGVWVIGPDACTVFVNEQVASMLGYTIAEMFGKPLFAFMDDEWRKVAQENLRRRRSGVREQHEFKLRRKDGVSIWVLISANPLHDEEGRYAGALAMINDITVRKEAELVLVQANIALEERVAARVRELTELNRRLLELVARDPLTGLLNRRAFDERLAQEAASALRHERPLCLLMIDIDHFKRINDSLGHTVGDAVLQAVAAQLLGAVRLSDVVARYGGEEFAVIVPQTALAGGAIVAERLRAAVANHPSSEGVTVTVSVGVAEVAPGDTTSSIVSRADAAMYRAKHDGRNRVRATQASTLPGR